jgi:hypothetical protein
MGGHVDRALVEDDHEWSHPKLQGFSLTLLATWKIQSERNTKVFLQQACPQLVILNKIKKETMPSPCYSK